MKLWPYQAGSCPASQNWPAVGRRRCAEGVGRISVGVRLTMRKGHLGIDACPDRFAASASYDSSRSVRAHPDPGSRMTPLDRVELAAIPIVGIIGWFGAGLLPTPLRVGSLLLGASVLLLLQGLVRDLWLLSRRRQGRHGDAPRESLCMCVESTLGVTGVIAGLALVGSGVDSRVAVSAALISFVAIGVLGIGFAIKDLIFEFRPFRIRRDKEHLNIVVRWKH